MAEHLTIQQAAEAYPALGLRFLRRLIAERRIPYSKVGGRLILTRTDVETLIARGRVEPSPGPRLIRTVSPSSRRRSA